MRTKLLFFLSLSFCSLGFAQNIDPKIKSEDADYFSCRIERKGSVSLEKNFIKEDHFPAPTKEVGAFTLDYPLRELHFTMVVNYEGKVSITVNESMDGKQISEKKEFQLRPYDASNPPDFKHSLELIRGKETVDYIVDCK